MFKMWREEEKDVTISYSDGRDPHWVVTQGFMTITGKDKKTLIGSERRKEVQALKEQELINDARVCVAEIYEETEITIEEDMFTNDDYAEAREALRKAYVPMNTLDCCTTASVPCDLATRIGQKYQEWDVLRKTAGTKTKKEDNMRSELYITTAPTQAASASLEQNKLSYLASRLSSIFCEKSMALSKTYGLEDDDRPTTPKEFVQRIKDGKFTLTKRAETMEEENDSFDYYCINDYLRWRDPATKEDKAGYKAALTLMEKAYADTRDTINIATPTEGLAALKAFEAQTFSVN